MQEPTKAQIERILTSDARTKAFRQKGVCIIYPSFLPHRVTKVTKGTRHAIVGWIHGPTYI